MTYNVGDTVVLDGIESVIVFDNGSEAEWGRYLCVDKNHDLSYYLEGSDFYNEKESDDVINTSAQYGYEWGGYDISCIFYSQETAIGEGLKNTNALISLNLQSETENWPILWDKVVEFRKNYSNKWFVPTVKELREVYDYVYSLENLSRSSGTFYWSSTEAYLFDQSEVLNFRDGAGTSYSYKYSHSIRSRLCRYTTDLELTSKTLQISTSTPEANIYYTTDNSTPTSNSNLYTNTFTADIGTTIKAIGIKEGYLDSDIVVLKDLTEFYNTCISEVYACVIEDCLELIRKHLPHSGFKKEYNIDPYFNSGVMLLNLKKLREDNIGTKLVESKLKNSKWPYMYQSQFNYLFKGKCNFKNKTFNFLNTLFEYPSEQYLHLIKKDDGNKYSDIYELIKDIVILHMTGNKKPWKYKENVPMSGTWLKYYKLSPYKNVPLIFKIEDTSTESKRLEFYKKIMECDSIKNPITKIKIYILHIPILKIIKKNNKTYIKLFGFIPLFKIKKC